jgi:hypothetical protein
MQETTDTSMQSRSDTETGSERQVASIVKPHAAFESFPSYMNASKPADRQRVFLVYRELFSGRNAAVRKTRAIRNIVLSPALGLKVSAADTRLDTIISILKSLLNDRVFESEEQASRFFPELFPVSPLELPASSISKKRKTSSGGSIERGRTLRTKRTDRSCPGTTAGMRFSILLSNP